MRCNGLSRDTRHVIVLADAGGAGWGGWEVWRDRLPAFSRDEAETLIIHAIHARKAAVRGVSGAGASVRGVGGTDTPPAPPTSEEFARIKSSYESTIEFLLAAVGCRPSQLLACFQHGQPMTDEQLNAAWRKVLVPGECGQLSSTGAAHHRAGLHQRRGLPASVVVVTLADDLKALLPSHLHCKLVDREWGSTGGCSHVSGAIARNVAESPTPCRQRSPVLQR